MLIVAIYYFASQTPVTIIPGLSGPAGKSLVGLPHPPKIEDHGGGGVTRLAVLVTDIDSDWIGMVRALKARGIPATFTRNVGEATRHHAVIAYPMISGRLLSGDQIRVLAAFVHSGGGLMTFDLAGGGLEPLFGIKGEVTGSQVR